jgi:hypothetical protein
LGEGALMGELVEIKAAREERKIRQIAKEARRLAREAEERAKNSAPYPGGIDDMEF